MRGRRWAGLAALLLLVLLVGRAAAHAELRRAQPEPGAVLTRAPSTVTLDFDSEIVSGGITLFGAGFTAVDSSSRQEDEDTLVAELPALADGRYTVQWDVIAVDGDPSSGSYDFVVDGSAGGGGGWRWLVGGAVALLLALGNWFLRRRRAAKG